MRLKLEFTNLNKGVAPEALLEKIAKETLKLCSPQASEIKISLVYLDKNKIKELNRKYRQKNKPTDVLSFLYTSGYNRKKGGEKATSLEGEIFLCDSIIRSSARQNKISFKEELAFVFSHGILHLLGMRHGQKMYSLQDEVVRRIKK